MDYNTLLKSNFDEIPRPKLLPLGSWGYICRAAAVQPPKGEGKKARILFTYEVQEPQNDVSDAALAELGDDYQSIVEPVFFNMFFDTYQDVDKIRKHLEMHGLDASKYSVEEGLKAVVGQPILGYTVQETYTDKMGNAQLKNAISVFSAVK